MVSYEPASGSKLSMEQANRYGPELERLAKSKGEELEPEEVVEAARPKSSPLHDFFIWDDDRAAVLWRREQARRLIGAIIVVRVVQGKPLEHRLTWNVTIEGVQGYAPMVKVIAKRTYRDQLINDALAELRAWCNRNDSIEELKSACGSLTDLIKWAQGRGEKEEAA